jgi:amino acid adenylation domain-containing protein
MKMDESRNNAINILPQNSEKELQSLVLKWNDTVAFYPKDKTLHQLFEEQVEKTPENVAVVFENKQLSYRELNMKANQLAHCLKRRYKEYWGNEIQRDTLVGIHVDRSLDMIVAILGILKAGAAYVPFDSSDPEERLKFKINDCGCSIVLTTSNKLKSLLHLIESDTALLALDTYHDEIEKYPDTNHEIVNTSSDLAYVIYTSGSTGKPKGVMVEHKTIINLLHWQKTVMNLDFTCNVFQFAYYNFDVSVQEIFSTLTAGGSLHIAANNLKEDIVELQKYLNKEDVRIIFLPPVILSIIFMSNDKFMTSGKHIDIITAGEQLIINENFKQYILKNDVTVHNHYGPTETHVTSAYRIDKNKNIDKYPPIGKPISNTVFYILGLDNMQPVSPGSQGELYIAGAGVARGYLNRPGLTKERFIENPFASSDDKAKESNKKIYKTGDIVRYNSNGDIEYIGRNDDQVKIRGFRVELGEIENKILEFDAINHAVVLCKEKNGNKYLVAYYTLVQCVDNIDDIESLDSASSLNGYYRIFSRLASLNYFCYFVATI